MKYLIVMMIAVIFITGCIDNEQPPVVKTPIPTPIPTVLETPVPVITLIEHPYYMKTVSPPLNLTILNNVGNFEDAIKKEEEERERRNNPVRDLGKPCPDLSPNCYLVKE